MPKIPPPKGTRDLYPLEAARRRWLSERWRKVSIRHGFEEVDGPTFETTDLYAVKSGEGILNELFQAFSGKDPKDIERIRAGDPAPFAMRPEFTPSLARMYAERARTLASPCKWFQIGPCFRAERPQRGRLREFLQWNLDIIGVEGGITTEDTESTEEGKARLDAELIACCVEFLREVGLSSDAVKIHINDRLVIETILKDVGVTVPTDQQEVMSLLDKRGKLTSEQFAWAAGEIGLSQGLVVELDRLIEFVASHHWTEVVREMFPGDSDVFPSLPYLFDELENLVAEDWLEFDPAIVRGLAYYTGTVFEVIADGERAIAGGGRYDNLIELFGGPPTPACGFAMGDVVISLLLQDTLGPNGKPLMPSDADLMEEIGARPDAFVIAPNDDLDDLATRLLATLRREGLHARRSYKATRKVPKLLKEASQQHARLAIILDSPTQATIKNLDSSTQQTVELPADDPFAPLLALIHDMLAATGT